MEWKAKMRSVFEHFVQRAPGSFVEEKEYSIVWHYRRVEPQFGHWLAAELAGLMEGLLAETDARPVLGRGIVEVRPVWVNKGLFASHLLAEEEPSFQLGAGDDSTDEDVFDRLGEHAWTIHVGTGRSRAKYWLKDTGAMLRLLDTLAATAEARAA
jgi:trehalose 6-phosphate synthase/phosphatase